VVQTSSLQFSSWKLLPQWKRLPAASALVQPDAGTTSGFSLRGPRTQRDKAPKKTDTVDTGVR